MSDALIEAAVRQTYADYLAVFQREDAPEAVLQFFQLPCLFSSPQGETLFITADGIRQTFATLKARLAALDYASSEVRDMSVKVLSEQLAAISLVAIRYDSGGAEFERLGAFYLLRQAEGRWRFVQLTMYDARRLLRLG